MYEVGPNAKLVN